MAYPKSSFHLRQCFTIGVELVVLVHGFRVGVAVSAGVTLQFGFAFGFVWFFVSFSVGSIGTLASHYDTRTDPTSFAPLVVYFYLDEGLYLSLFLFLFKLPSLKKKKPEKKGSVFLCCEM